MSTEAQTDVTHADLELSLRRLMSLRTEFQAAKETYEELIANTQGEIETQAFAVFPSIDEGCAYWDGDPIQFLAGAHHITICRVADQPQVDIDRTHMLDVSGDLFAADRVPCAADDPVETEGGPVAQEREAVTG